MDIPKEILEKVARLTENRECNKTEISIAMKVSTAYLHKCLKTGEISENKYYKLLAFLEKLDKKIAERKERESNLINQNP